MTDYDCMADRNVVPIFKQGERFIPSNYKPVSLTYIGLCCKCFVEHVTCVMASDLMNHLQSENILYEWQHGFKSN